MPFHRARKRYLSSEHGGVSLAAHDVVLVELPVVGDGLREALHGVGDALLEAPAPQLGLLLVLALRGRHRGGGCSDGREGGATAPERDAVGGGGEAGAGEGDRCPEDEALGGGGHGRRHAAGVVGEVGLRDCAAEAGGRGEGCIFDLQGFYLCVVSLVCAAAAWTSNSTGLGRNYQKIVNQRFYSL
jgi:hypothetical protein